MLAGPLAADNFTSHTLEVSGQKRTYHVHEAVPAGSAVPVVLNLHGGGGNGRSLRDTVGFKPWVLKGQAVAVYPDARGGSWLPDDVEFLDQVLDAVFATGKGDRARLYVTGASRGGLMTYTMVARSRHPIRAAGSVIATQLEGLAREFPIERPVDFAVIAGTEDPLMPYQGGWGAFGRPATSGDPAARLLSVEETVALFLRANDLTGEPAVTNLGNRSARDQCTNEVKTWRHPQTGRRVQLVTVIGGGHVVPGGGQYLPVTQIGRASADFNYAEVLWSFFTSTTAAAAPPPAGVSLRPPPPTPPAPPALPPPSQPASGLDPASEQALRERVALLFEALRRGDIAQCLSLSEPARINQVGRATAENFFRGISNLTRLGQVGPGDRVILGLTAEDEGRRARVRVQLTLKGQAQPPATEIWVRDGGTWLYRETVP